MASVRVLESGFKEMIPVLQVNHLTSGILKDGLPIFSSISLDLMPHDQLVLTGDSGAGKSLLLRSIVFLEPIASGDIFFLEKKVAAAEIPFYRSRVIYLPQKPTLEEGSVESNLKSAFKNKIHQNKTFDINLNRERLERFGFGPSFIEKPAKLLSGGEAQIVALLRALTLDPAILLLDEPTASLDQNKAHVFEEEVLSWVKNGTQRSFIWVTHQKEQENTVGNKFFRLGNSV